MLANSHKEVSTYHTIKANLSHRQDSMVMGREIKAVFRLMLSTRSIRKGKETEEDEWEKWDV
jgi:hypothetical protein